MAIDLSTLILKVRARLDGVGTDALDDSQIYLDLQHAEAYLSIILSSTVTDYQKTHCLISLGTYYSYLNYTSLAERRLGDLPVTAYVRLKALKDDAYSFIQPLAKVPITPDFVVDEKAMARTGGIAYALTRSTIED